MDVRLKDTANAVDLPELNVYDVQPGTTLREHCTNARDAEGRPVDAELGQQWADALDTDRMAALLLQGDQYEAADDEATQVLADLLVLGGHLNPPAPRSEPADDVPSAGPSAAQAPAQRRPGRTTA